MAFASKKQDQPVREEPYLTPHRIISNAVHAVEYRNSHDQLSVITGVLVNGGHKAKEDAAAALYYFLNMGSATVVEMTKKELVECMERGDDSSKELVMKYVGMALMNPTEFEMGEPAKSRLVGEINAVRRSSVEILHKIFEMADPEISARVDGLLVRAITGSVREAAAAAHELLKPYAEGNAANGSAGHRTRAKAILSRKTGIALRT